MPSCYVATVVYGNKHAPEVETLREIRDNVLRENYFGRQFVKFYYSGAGEKVAKFLNDKVPVAKQVIKSSLDFIVQQYKKSKRQN